MNRKKKLIPEDGVLRVIIDRVSPCIDNHVFPHKYVAGECVNVEADVFTDGHDCLTVVFQYKKWGDVDYTEIPLKAEHNDLWLGEFWPEENGYYEYNIAGWIDHYATWLNNVRKKAEDGQDVSVELLIGSELVEEASTRAGEEDSVVLTAFAKKLKSEAAAVSARLDVLDDDEMHDLVLSYPDRKSESRCNCDGILFAERERAAFSTWYEFFPRSFGEKPGEHGTFKSAQKLLPKIADMKFSVVYLPPIHPIGEVFRKGRNNALVAGKSDVGSPWAIGSKDGGHKAVNPLLGTLDDFSSFVKAAESHGLEIALDIAFQCAPDHPYVREHPQWFKWRPDNTVQYAENPPKKYQDILPFDFECDDWKNLWKELRSVFMFWIKRGVKIFRVDNPHTKPINFWQWCICEIKKDHPDVIFLAEAFTRPKIKYRLGRAGFTHGYTYFTWRNTKEELTQYVTELKEKDVRHSFWPNFWPNTPDILHDSLQYGGRPAFIVRYILAATMSSNTGIYGPAFELCDHEAFPGKEEYNNNEKYQLKDWDWNAPGNIRAIVQRMNHIRNDNSALQRTHNIEFVDVDNPNLIAYLKCSPDMLNVVLVVINLDFNNTQEGWLTVPIEKLHIGESNYYLMQDMLPEHEGPMPEANYMWKGEKNYIKLDPQVCPAHVFHVYRNRKQENNFDYWI